MIKSLFIISLFIGMTLHVQATQKLYPALSAYVIKVAKDDTLNVREAPNNRAKIVGTWADEAWMMIDHCVKVGKSTWCKAEQDTLTGDGALGWVNAHYLKFINEGFVIQKDGKGDSCMYASKCEKQKEHMQCYIMNGYYLDEAYEVRSEGRWVERSSLLGGTILSAAKELEMCGNLPYAVQQNSAKKLQELHKKDNSKAYQTVTELLRIIGQPEFRENTLVNIAKLIHPTKGVIVTDMVSFKDKSQQHYDAKTFLKTLKDDKKILWGKTYAKGDLIRKTLYAWIDDAHREMSSISKIETLKGFKGFETAGYSGLKAYEVYWINEESKSKEYDWLGLVVLVSEYKGKWYVVGLLRDRWTI